MSKKATYVLALSLVLALTVCGQAAVRTTADGNGGDTYLTNDASTGPDSANAWRPFIEIRKHAAPRIRIGYIRFDLTGVEGDLSGATLTLSTYQNRDARTFNIYALVDDVNDDAWDEATITYNNAPGFLPADLGQWAVDPNKIIPVGVFDIGQPAGSYTSNPNDLNLDEVLANDTNKLVTLAIVWEGDDQGNVWNLASKERGDGTEPKLFLPNAIDVDAANIVWVSFHEADDAPAAAAANVGFTEASDKAYTDLLAFNGYNVTRYLTTGTPDVNVVEAADLVIIGRAVSSSHYQNDAATRWNSVRAPMIIMGGYVLRSSRMGFTTGTDMPDTTGDIKLAVSDPNHPIFAGIELVDGIMANPYASGAVVLPTDGVTVSRGISINNNPADDDGALLGVIAAADPNDPNALANGPVGGMVIGEWAAGAMLTHAGGAGTDILAGRRLVFLSGSREPSGVTGGEASGLYDLYADGTRMFLNAVNYMLPKPPIVANGSFELPGTVKQNNWDGGTNGKGTFEDVPGWSSDVMAEDSGVESSSSYPATDGVWTGFLKGSDPSIWQLTDLVMLADDVIELKVDARNNWAATTLRLSLYIDVMGERTAVASADFELTDAMQEFTLTFAVQDQPLAAGMRLGIELANVTAEGASWMGLDNVRVELK